MEQKALNNLSRKERETLRRRREILEASEAVFAEKGYVSATMEEIAQKAEFAVGTLYKFFENKAALYEETMLERIKELEEEFYEVLGSDRTPSDKIRKYFFLRLEMFWRHLKFHRLFFGGPLGTIPDINLGFLPEIVVRYERFVAQLEEVFLTGIKSGAFKNISPRIATLCLEGILRAYFDNSIRIEDPCRNLAEEKALFALFKKGVYED